nr:winged helix-turn-helix domain-containing protein [Methanothermus fervidus]
MQELKSSIFSTKKGLKIVNSPTKLKILNLLMENGEMYFNEIVNAVGKSKSTISTHLKDLINEGIVKSKVSPRNRRKKIFYVESKYLGKIMQRSPYKFHENIEDLKKLLKDGSRGFYRLMFHLIRVELMKKGIDLDPILKNVGKKLGKIIYDEVEEKNFEKLLIKLVNFWQKYGLGKMEIKKKKTFRD